MNEKKYYVYILTTRKNTSLYIGVTSNLSNRIYEHKEGLVEGYTKKYSVNKFIYAEEYDDVNEAIHREKCLKRWKRDWKVELIDKSNPEWVDLFEENNNPAPAFAGVTRGDA